MRARPLLVAVLLGALAAKPVPASELGTVCTMTVNSVDEADAFRRALPASRYRFVELVERGRTDWLASACARGIACDVLIVSGHYDGEGMFFSDRVDAAEHLPVRELERVACSASCPGLFARLRQVYLFGCHTLSAAPVPRAWRDGGVLAAEESAPPLAARHGESSRDRMARLFAGVPVLYGFASFAPVGPVAGGILARYFRDGGAADVDAARPSARLLAHFAPQGMVSAQGLAAGDPREAHRRDVCRFADERLGAAERAAFAHEVLQRPGPAIVTLLPLLEQLAGDLGAAGNTSALAGLAADDDARTRFLGYARTVADAALQARLLALARRVGWLDAIAWDDAIGRLLVDRLARGAGASDVDLACRLAADEDPGRIAAALRTAATASPARDAMLACHGDDAARDALLAHLADGKEDALDAFRAFVAHRPPRDATQWQAIVDAVLRLPTERAQALALDALARTPVPTQDGLVRLVDLYTAARTSVLQRAVAGVLLRSDVPPAVAAQVASAIRGHRLSGATGRDIIDVLLRRLDA